MSAWGIGATALTRRGIGVRRAGADAATAEPPVPSVDTLVTWIPGEVIAAYSGLVLALQPEGDPSTSSATLEVTAIGWLISGFIAAVVLTWLGGWTKVKKLEPPAQKELFFRALFAGMAFAIWSFVVPGSWWYSMDGIASHQAIVPIIVGLVGTMFALLAEGVVRRIAPADSGQRG